MGNERWERGELDGRWEMKGLDGRCKVRYERWESECGRRGMELGDGLIFKYTIFINRNISN